MEKAELIAKQFHETYERLAPKYGYKTREASAVPWEQVPEKNRKLMIATVEQLLEGGWINSLVGDARLHRHRRREGLSG